MIHDEFPDWHEVLRVSRSAGFDSDSDQSDNETDAGLIRQGTSNSQPFRPWQGGGRSNGAAHDVTEGSVSESSGVEQSQGARPKVLTNKNRYGDRFGQKKMTEIVAEKMKASRGKTRKNKINFNAPNYQHQNSGNPAKRLNDRQKPQTSSSLQPDTTRGSDTTGSMPRSSSTSQPMNAEHPRDTRSAVASQPMADEPARETFDNTNTVNENTVNESRDVNK